jgi:alginate O-acetyltransferase complex protein AlgI
MLETFISWYFALKMKGSKKSKLYMIVACICLLGLLAIFKYTGFFLNNLSFFIHWPSKVPTIILPIGISFYTFQLLSYVVDVYRKEVTPQEDYWKLLLYSSLFHQCIAGPIVRYETVQNEIDNRKVSFNDVAYGFRRFSIGLAKKAILANSCASITDTLLPGGIDGIHGQSALGIWLAMICYMLQIYLDFSAYSDMAIGMGRMIGFHYLENFNYPYIAKSVQDFWRRWHISLSSFFRDYVYIPLGGNRVSQKKWIRNMFVVWFLTGMWHGASWNYILWGLYYLCFLLLEKFYIKDRIPDKWKHVYTLIVIFFGWIIFKYSDLSQLGAVLLGMFGIGSAGFYSMDVKTVFLSNIFFLVFSMLACTTLGRSLHKYLL